MASPNFSQSLDGQHFYTSGVHPHPSSLLSAIDKAVSKRISVSPSIDVTDTIPLPDFKSGKQFLAAVFLLLYPAY